MYTHKFSSFSSLRGRMRGHRYAVHSRGMIQSEGAARLETTTTAAAAVNWATLHHYHHQEHWQSPVLPSFSSQSNFCLLFLSCQCNTAANDHLSTWLLLEKQHFTSLQFACNNNSTRTLLPTSGASTVLPMLACKNEKRKISINWICQVLFPQLWRQQVLPLKWIV